MTTDNEYAKKFESMTTDWDLEQDAIDDALFAEMEAPAKKFDPEHFEDDSEEVG